MEPTLSQALHLMNGDTVNNKIREGGVITTLKEQGLELKSEADESSPVNTQVDAPKKAAMCLCKKTGTAPYCDGTHAKLE